MGCSALGFGVFLAYHIHTCQQTRASLLHSLKHPLHSTYRGKSTSKDLLVFSQHHSECGMGHSGYFGIVPADHLSSCKHCLQMHRLQGTNTNNWFLTHSSRYSRKFSSQLYHLHSAAFTMRLKMFLAPQINSTSERSSFQRVFLAYRSSNWQTPITAQIRS